MPRRNLLILFLVAVVAILCRQRVEQNPYVRVLGRAMNRIEDVALDPVGEKKLFEGAMYGMLSQFDEYSTYLSPADLERFHEAVDLQFAGVGLTMFVEAKTKQLVVASPVANSPAARAGILAGDRILRIGKTAAPISLQDAYSLLRGKPGTTVKLLILRRIDAKPVEVALVRENVQEESVLGDTRNPDGSWNYLLEGHDRIGYLRISCFTEQTTARELAEALQGLGKGGMRGLVLDLRDNPGGYLNAAVAVCDMLVKSGEIVTTRDRQGNVCQSYSASGNARFTDFPVAVVVNQDTASAAEIVAACLQDNRRAVVVGQRTFGKGVVQDLIDLEQGCGAIRITAKSYWRPSGKDIRRPRGATAKDEWGVSPNEGYKIVLNKDEFNRWQIWRNGRDLHTPTPDDPAEKKDAKPFVDRQRQRAVEYVEQEAARGENAPGRSEK